MKGIYTKTQSMRMSFHGVTTLNLKGIYTLADKYKAYLNGVTTLNLKGIYTFFTFHKVSYDYLSIFTISSCSVKNFRKDSTVTL